VCGAHLTRVSAGKVGIVYNGGQHAREWISPMTNAWIANQLVTLYGKDAQITNFVDNIEWTIIPIVNADGYVYTWTTDRMWRKNRYASTLVNSL
jgi:murein tripeptide amidase MpaA